jgi:hypothetical protein
MRNLTYLLGGLFIVCGIVSVNLWRELRAERQVISELRAQLRQQPVAATAAATPLPGFQASARPPDDAPGQQEPAALIASSTDARPPAANATANTVNLVVEQRELMKDPEYRRAMLAQLRLTLPQTYPGLIEEMGLTEDQANALFDLLAEQQLEQTALMTPLSGDGSQRNQEQVREYSERSQDLTRQRDEKIAALLGNTGRERFKAYEATRPARMQAQSMQRTLESAGAPLRPEQMRALTDAYVNEQQRQQEDLLSMMRATNVGDAAEQQMQAQGERNRRLVEAMRPHLTLQQIERLQATLDQQLAMNRASSRLLRERLEAQVQPGQEPRSVIIQSAPIQPPPAF